MSLINNAGICYHFYRWIGGTHPFDTIPVGRCPMMIKKTTLSKEKGSCTHACCQLCVLILLYKPIKEALIMPFPSCTHPAWHNQDVKGWSILNCHMRLHQ